MGVMPSFAEIADRTTIDALRAPLIYPGGVHIPYASLSDVTAAYTVTATAASKGWNSPTARPAATPARATSG